MNKPLLVGVTGGIGSGKSIVCQVLHTLGVPIYFADDRAKALLVVDQELKRAITGLFGVESYIGDQLNRNYLAERVFNNEAELEKLNALVHPAVAKDFESFIQTHSDQSIVVKEAALLFETGSYQHLDKNVSVLAPKELRIQRVLLRDPQRSQNQVEEIIKKQTSDNQRKKLSDYLIYNDGDQLLLPQVISLYKELTKLAG